MSETLYSKQYLNSQVDFNKTGFTQEDKDINKENKSLQKTKNSFKTINTFKTSNNFRRRNNIINIKNESSTVSPINKTNSNKNQLNFSPISPIQQTQHKFFNFRFNKAPTLKQNQIEINKIIKRKKMKRIEELRNIYNNILINESKTYRNNLYVTGNGFYSQKNKTLRRNRSCDELNTHKMNSYKSINEINNSSVENSSLFSKTGFNFNNNSSKNIFDNDNKTINKSLLYQDIINKSKNKSNLLPSLSTSKRKSIFLPINSISKMRILVNDVIFNELKSVKEFYEKENTMIKFRVIQNIQNKQINNIKNKGELELENKINKLIELKNIFENKYNNYSYKMKMYIYFLKDTLYEIKDNLQIIDKEIFNKNIDIEKLILKIVKKQYELKHLIEIRNFLLQVKDKYENNEKSPSYYLQLLIKESKIILIGNYFLNLNVINQITNKSVTTFMAYFLELKEKIEDKKIFIDDFDYNLNYFKKAKIKPIFESVDEFMKIFNFLMEKNLNYLQQFESIKKIINKLKDQYEQISCMGNDNSFLKDEIIEKNELKEKLVKHNEILKKRYNYYIELQKKKTQIEIYSPKKLKTKKTYLDINIDLDLVYREKYNNKLKTLKYNGILLLEKVINVVKNFFKLGYHKKEFSEKFLKKDKLKLLELNLKEFNVDNIQLIDKYIIKVISLYEDICKYILTNHNNYMKDKKYSDIIKVMEEKINRDRKLNISQEQRRMKIIIKNEEKQKIIEKCYKPIVYIENKMNTDTKIKRRKILKIKDEQKLEDEEKNFEENEFNYFTKYNDEDNI